MTSPGAYLGHTQTATGCTVEGVVWLGPKWHAAWRKATAGLAEHLFFFLQALHVGGHEAGDMLGHRHQLEPPLLVQRH